MERRKRGSPWMAMYWDDYLRDTRHLSTAQHGAYLLLIGQYWVSGRPLPADDETLRRITGMDRREWKKAAPLVLAMFIRDGETYRHKRIDVEMVHAHELVTKKVEAGRQGGRNKAKKSTAGASRCQPDAVAQLQQNGSISSTPLTYNQVPNGTYSEDKSSAAEQPMPDLAKLAFDGGVKLLMAGGKSEADARAIIGRWRKSHSDAEIIAALGSCQREGAIDPVAFITGALKAASKPASTARIGLPF